MSDSQKQINAFSSDKWKCSFSNIPTVGANSDLAFVYENFIRSVSLPDINLEIIQSNFKGSVINHPVTPDNKDYSDLLIEFQLDENFLNYFNLFEYLQEVRFGEIRRSKPSQSRNSIGKKDSLIRLYDIKSIDIMMLDNERHIQKILRFTECFIHSLSTISLQFGKSEPVSFTVNIKYQDISLVDPT